MKWVEVDKEKRRFIVEYLENKEPIEFEIDGEFYKATKGKIYYGEEEK